MLKRLAPVNPRATFNYKLVGNATPTTVAA